MKHDLQGDLFDRYPKIFSERFDSQSSRKLGIDVGDGWFDLIDTLCDRLQYSVDQLREPQPSALQVKAKWGELRFYIDSQSVYQKALIDLAQALSSKICDHCGKPCKQANASPYASRCTDHAVVTPT
jgi:hypothetical protein